METGKYRKLAVAVKYRLGFGDEQLRKISSLKFPHRSVVVVATNVFVRKIGIHSQIQKRMEFTFAIKACLRAAESAVCAITCKFKRSAAGAGASVETGLANWACAGRATRDCNAT